MNFATTAGAWMPCRRRRRIGLGFVLALCALLGRAEAADVRIHGPAGSFGRVLEGVPAGLAFETSTLPEPAFLPGKAAFFTTSTSDGTVFVAGFHQNRWNLVPTGCHMNVVCINPRAATCFDASDGQAKHFSHLLVEARDGSTIVPRDPAGCTQPSTSFAFPVAGADISDIDTVIDALGNERVAFVSSLASLGGYPTSDFPALGFISKMDGAWRLDARRQYWRDDIARSSPAALLACPGGGCGGFSEIAFLPKSRRLAIGVYFPQQQGLLIASLDGEVLAQQAMPHPGNRCTKDPSDVVDWLGVRQVEVDPTAPLGDERIAITIDGREPFSHPIQELSYDDATQTLRPVTNLVVTAGGGTPLPDCTSQGQNVAYDRDGNLVVGKASGTNAAYHVYVKDAATGRRSIESRCPFTGYGEDEIAQPCSADLSIGAVLGIDRDAGPHWGFNAHNVNTVKAARSSILARIDMDGSVDLLDYFSTQGLPVYVTYPPLGLGVGRLGKGEHTSFNAVWKGTLEENAGKLWVPVATILETVPPGCTDGIYCEVHVNQASPSWLYEIDYDAVADHRLRATAVTLGRAELDRRSNERASFVVETNRNASVLRRGSGLWLHPRDGPLPVLHERVQRGVCTAGRCQYRAMLRQSRLRDLPPGRYRWTMALTLAGSPDVLSAQGVIDVR